MVLHGTVLYCMRSWLRRAGCVSQDAYILHLFKFSSDVNWTMCQLDNARQARVKNGVTKQMITISQCSDNPLTACSLSESGNKRTI